MLHVPPPRPAAAASPKKRFAALFDETARYHHRLEVFRDFVTVGAVALHNGAAFCQRREDEYLRIMGRYRDGDPGRLQQLMAITVEALEEAPRDFLGEIFMSMELGDARRGQFYTPHGVSEMMCEMLFADLPDRLDDKPFVTVSEPACGAGGMILPLVGMLQRKGHDPARRLWVQAVDVDRTSALMCYIQLSLWGVPAEVIVGNALTFEVRETWKTPMYHMMGWRRRLAEHGVREGFPEP